MADTPRDFHDAVDRLITDLSVAGTPAGLWDTEFDRIERQFPMVMAASEDEDDIELERLLHEGGRQAVANHLKETFEQLRESNPRLKDP